MGWLVRTATITGIARCCRSEPAGRSIAPRGEVEYTLETVRVSPGGGERPSDLLSRCRGSSLGSVQVSPGGGEGPSDILSNYAMCGKEGTRDQTEVYSLSTALYTGEGGPGATQRFHN